MLRTSAKIRGNMEADLQAFAEQVQGQVALSGVASMARVIYDSARSHAPVSEHEHYFYGSQKGKRWGPFEPGNLRDAIYRVFASDLSSDTKKIYRVAWNHKKAPYGFMVEYGTSHAPAHPFLTPAFSEIHDAIAAGKERMKERIKELKAPTDAGKSNA